MESEALVQLALNTLSCSQKELAERLGVSPTQISKWKKGDHMSPEMAHKLRELTGIGSRDAQFVLWAGSLDVAIKWERLIIYLAELASDSAETGYDTPLLLEDTDSLCWHTFYTLKEMGVAIPQMFPPELEIPDEASQDDEDDDEPEWMLAIDRQPIASLIYAIYKSLTDVYGFFAAYMSGWIFDDDVLDFETASNVDSSLMALAASKVDVDEGLANNFSKFKHKVNKDYVKWLTAAKNSAYRAGIPLGAELLDLVHASHEEIGHEAEGESLGFNASRLHPDVYMNELLVGMRAIHQVLPAILKKLGIEDEFQLDTSELRQKG